MKKYIYMAVAAIAALSSCSSDNDPIMGETGKQALVFTATMEGSEGTRAIYDSDNKCASWEAGDQISINGVNYSALTAGTTTTFAATTQGQEAKDSPYHAYFACTYDGVTATLPAAVTETWAADKFNMPMYATSTTTDLPFKNLCGVLKITVKNDQIGAVKKIRVSSENCATSGDFTVVNNAAELINPEATANTLTVTYTEAVTTVPTGKVFYVAVPAQTYQELQIELAADNSYFTTSMTTKSTGITVARKTIYPITFADNAPATTGTAKRASVPGGTDSIDVNWVQLWKKGPKFAEYNVGALYNKPEEYGGYYCWGGVIDQDPDGNCNMDGNELTGNDDTATNLWGRNWRMPKEAELQALIDNCDVEWTTVNDVNGLKFTGKKEPYIFNSVFLPAASFCHYGNVDLETQGNYGNYWSSTPTDLLGAFSLDFSSSGQRIEGGQINACMGYSVRAVLAE